MTKELILMRHAKSAWDDPMLEDHERPLNGRGRHSAAAGGDWLRNRKRLPDQALISSATRTRETFIRLGVACDAGFSDDLYHASAGTMQKVLKSATGDRVLMLGHNPGIAAFAEELLARTPDHSSFFAYPTCATLIASFEIDSWSELQMGTGTALEFVVPRELTG